VTVELACRDCGARWHLGELSTCTCIPDGRLVVDDVSSKAGIIGRDLQRVRLIDAVQRLLAIDERRVAVVRETLGDVQEGITRTTPIMEDYKAVLAELRGLVDG
jgi:hypothetical protein